MLDNLPKRLNHYRILPADLAEGRYTLFAGEVEAGSLTLKNLGSEARILSGLEDMTIARTAPWRKHAKIRRSGAETSDVFYADTLSRGTLALGGESYRWVPANKQWTEWDWKKRDGATVARIHLDHGISGWRGTISADSDLPDPVEKELALFGWYLLLLNHEHFGSHLVNAFRIYFSPAQSKV